MKYYDVIKYESQLFYYNMFDRLKKYEYKDSDLLKHHLMGFDDSNDRVSEFSIWCEYREHYLKKPYDFAETVKLIYEFHSNLSNITKGRNIVGCSTHNVHDAVKKTRPKEFPILKNPDNHRFVIDEIEENIEKTISDLEYQSKLLKQTSLSENPILSKEYYINQIEKIKKATIDISSWGTQIKKSVGSIIGKKPNKL